MLVCGLRKPCVLNNNSRASATFIYKQPSTHTDWSFLDPLEDVSAAVLGWGFVGWCAGCAWRGQGGLGHLGGHWGYARLYLQTETFRMAVSSTHITTI